MLVRQRKPILRKTPLRRTPTRRPKRAKRVLGAKKTTKTTTGRVWTLKRADKEFSRLIRERDKMCLFPGCGVRYFAKLQCSHYIGRAVSATRFDPENCIALCWTHHYHDKIYGYEYQKQRADEHGWDGPYTTFMRNWLGEERFAALLQRSKTTVKRSNAILALMALVDNEEKRSIYGL